MNNRFRRRRPTLIEKTSILIICCGEKTEFNYFKKIKGKTRYKPLHLDIIPHTVNPSGMVELAIKYLDDQYDQIWCVFDKDDFEDIKKAYEMAGDYEKVQIAFSNPCFELWYCLHFSYSTAAMTYATCKAKLSSCLGKTYNKTDPTHYEQLEQKIPTAISNAKRLAAMYESESIEEHLRNPYTSVHLLIEEIERLMNS